MNNIVYRYKLDEDSNLYLYRDEYECQPDPESEGEFLIPRYSTFVKPNIEDGKLAYWEDDQWKYMDDYRNITYYNKNTCSKVDTYLIRYKDLYKYTKEKPVYKNSIFNEDENKWELDIDGTKAHFKSLINLKEHNTEKQSITLFTSKNKEIEVNDSYDLLGTLEKLINYTTYSEDGYANFRVYDNSIVKLDAEDLKRMYSEIMENQQKELQEKWAKKDIISKLSTKEEVLKYAEENNIDLLYSEI